MTEPAVHDAALPDPGSPPTAKRVPAVRHMHGEAVVDEYAWLRDRDDPDVVAYLEAENAYTREVLTPTSDLRRTVFPDCRCSTGA